MNMHVIHSHTGLYTALTNFIMVTKVLGVYVHSKTFHSCLQVIDIPSTLKELRFQRMHLVQMIGQYKFVYNSIIQYIGRARLI